MRPKPWRKSHPKTSTLSWRRSRTRRRATTTARRSSCCGTSAARANGLPSLSTGRHVPREAEPEKGRVILTVDQAARLMEASTDPDICALNAMILFGGLRREEVEKLDWLRLISKPDTSTFRPKFPRWHANATRLCGQSRNWLLPLAQKRGPIVLESCTHSGPPGSEGLNLWPQDAHRHSFISYRRRIIGDAQTALDAGTFRNDHQTPLQAARSLSTTPNTSFRSGPLPRLLRGKLFK